MNHRGGALAKTTVDRDSPFYVPKVLDLLGGAVQRFPRTWLWLGRLETKILSSQLVEIQLRRPIYVCGLARSGSTLLHEVICSHPRVATHRLKDFPFISTPYWWRRATAKRPRTEARERPHRDRMMVTMDSPDSVEEMLWMAFFPEGHNPDRDNRLVADSNRAFDDYYLNHLRKMLFAEGANRYAAKANYHVARMEYLLRLLPDARFILPVRAPAEHIASLVRQHEWFSSGHRQSPRSLAFMQRSGHFEFGLDRRPVNLGDRKRVDSVREAWASGEEVLGWARYWNLVYRYLADLLASHEAIRKATLVVRFEDLCSHPADRLEQVLDHCDLLEKKPILDKYVPAIHRPDYYSSPFSAAELEVIRAETAETASRWGY